MRDPGELAEEKQNLEEYQLLNKTLLERVELSQLTISCLSVMFSIDLSSADLDECFRRMQREILSKRIH